MTRSEKLEQLFKELVNGLGYELWACVVLGPSSNQTLRVYIDKPDGIHVDDCETVSHHLSSFIEVEGCMKNNYILEVSSPGLDRPLFTLDHYTQFVGSEIKFKFYEAQNNRKNLVGTLKSVSEEGVLTVESDNETLDFTLNQVAKASLVY